MELLFRPSMHIIVYISVHLQLRGPYLFVYVLLKDKNTNKIKQIIGIYLFNYTTEHQKYLLIVDAAGNGKLAEITS